MPITITPIYAAILVVIMVALFFHVVRGRLKYRVSILDGGNEDMARRVRVHGNFIENVPMALLILAFAEIYGMPSMIVHGVGILLVISRILHAAGLNLPVPTSKARFLGAVGTLFSLLIPAIYIGYRALLG